MLVSLAVFYSRKAQSEKTMNDGTGASLMKDGISQVANRLQVFFASLRLA